MTKERAKESGQLLPGGELGTVSGVNHSRSAWKHGQIPRSLHFERPNPEIPFDNLRLRVVKALENWPDTNGHQRRASVNSFGFGGTNAHVVLENAPESTAYQTAHQSPFSNPAFLMPFSAQRAEALRALVRSRVGFFLEDVQCEATALRDISYSCGLRRTHHDDRLSVVTQNPRRIG
jgi:acyl transferase domain-containing protein